MGLTSFSFFVVIRRGHHESQIENRRSRGISLRHGELSALVSLPPSFRPLTYSQLPKAAETGTFMTLEVVGA